MPTGVYIRTEKQKKRLRELRIGQIGRSWTDGKVGYQAIHMWLRTNFGNADHCENPKCEGKSKYYHYALIKGKEYERKRDNFVKLCKSCHQKYDRNNTNTL